MSAVVVASNTRLKSTRYHTPVVTAAPADATAPADSPPRNVLVG